jgi:hypothetical protein
VPHLISQNLASWCCELLGAIADALSDWSAAVGRAGQQLQQQLRCSTQQPAEPLGTASDLHETGIWLPAAASNLLARLQLLLYSGSAVDELQLHGVLAILLRKVLSIFLCAAAVVRDPFSRRSPMYLMHV